MELVAQLTLEEYERLPHRRDFEGHFHPGDIFLDEVEDGEQTRTRYFVVNDVVHGYGNGEPLTSDYRIQIVS